MKIFECVVINSFTELTDKVTSLELMVTEANKENAKLQEDLAERDRTIDALKDQLNEATQYQRQWSIRVIGLPLSEQEKNNNFAVKQSLYRNLLLPILEGAVSAGDIPSVPPPSNSSKERIFSLLHRTSPP